MQPFELHLGDCLESLRKMPDNSVDAIVTDPPYELGFMGKGWDKSGIANNVDMWREALRVLKPGGHLLAFSGSRTYHRMTCAIEDAGFEVRDQIMWLYGSGFPKSLDVSKAIDKAAGAEREVIGTQPDRWTGKGGVLNFATDRPQSEIPVTGAPATEAARQWQGWGTALKPAHEPIVVARKPLVGTVAENVLAHGTGALNIDGCRVGTETRTNASKPRADRNGFVDGFVGGTQSQTHDHGRWPANIIHDGSDEVLAAFPTSASPWIGNPNKGAKGGKMFGGSEQSIGEKPEYRDSGSAARFFYCPKASKRDRDEGLGHLPTVTADPYGQHRGRRMDGNDTRIDGKPPSTGKNHHPTVKPTELMAYLVRLVTPPGGVVLDPFMGSGSTGKAAMREGFRFIGCELSEEYLAIARARIEHELSKRQVEASKPSPQVELFDA